MNCSDRPNEVRVFPRVFLGKWLRRAGLLCVVGVFIPVAVAEPPAPAATSAQSRKACPQRGLQIPPEVPGVTIGDIPGWPEKYSGEVLYRDLKQKGFYGQEIIADGRTTCLVLDFADSDRRREILDSVDISDIYPEARRIPKHFKSAKRGVELSYCYVLRPDGSFDRDSHDRIIGFTLPRKGHEGCNHYSRWVLGAWRIDYAAGRYVPVPHDKVICNRPEAGDSCY